LALTTADFDYDLPSELIAQTPAEPRDRCRLLALERGTGRLTHKVFADLPEFLRAGDLLVLNDTRVVPARFHCRRGTGGLIEGLFLREHSEGTWEVMLKRGRRCRVGEALEFTGDPQRRATLTAKRGEGIWHVKISPPAPALELLERIGKTPLPPYIRRPGPMGDSEDRRAYQTVFAARPGAVAAPTAGLHFTEALLGDLRAKGVERVAVTLHVGWGTFAPVKTDRLDQHCMHEEFYELSASAAEAIQSAKAQRRRVVAAGTTVVRAVESAAAMGPLEARRGWTNLFLYPPAEFRVFDALVTNFHLPRSTLLMLVAAFCSPGRTDGIKMILETYREAVEKGYRFYSYGDAMLVL